MRQTVFSDPLQKRLIASRNGHGNHAGNFVTVQGAHPFHKLGQGCLANLCQQQAFARLAHLAEQRPACFMEFSTRIMRRRGVDPAAITALLERFGYDHVSIFEAGRLIEQSRSLERLIASADAAPYYVDALLEHCGTGRPLLEKRDA